VKTILDIVLEKPVEKPVEILAEAPAKEERKSGKTGGRKKREKDLLRKNWPKVRVLRRAKGTLYQVDGRMKGTAGKQEHFSTQADALKRAGEIEDEWKANGNEGLALSADLRAMAIFGAGILEPFGKTVAQACEFYRDYLQGEKQREESVLTGKIADLYLKDKQSGNNKVLRLATIRDHKQIVNVIKAGFGNRPIMGVSREDIQTFLDGKDISLVSKSNMRSRISQFFNWAIEKKHCLNNPCNGIKIHLQDKDVEIFTPKQAKKLMRLCEGKFPDLIVYHAIALFAGLRPDECKLLTWENIHLEERTITVLTGTTKVKETRNVHIEDNLLTWLQTYRPKNGGKGFITPQERFRKETLALHVAAGFKGMGENLDAPEWVTDILRHSFGSYWLGKHKNRNQLAEEMGNSLAMIKKHYRKVVSKTDIEAFWAILPKGAKEDKDEEKDGILDLIPDEAREAGE